jgi:hypothetical protein
MTIQPVSLTAEQVEELAKKLSTMRHDINNYLALITAASELIRYKPEMSERMMTTLGEQPQKILDSLARFSSEFETLLGMKKG